MKYFSKKNLLYFTIAAGALLILVIILAGGGGSSKKQEPASEAPLLQPAVGYDQFSSFAGERQGTWTNTTFSTKGGISANIIVNPDGAASFTVDVGGMVFGLVDPDPKTFAGTYGPAELYFSDHDDLFGDFTISIKPSGEFTMNAPSVEAPGIDRLEVNGTILGNQIQARYQVFMKGRTRAEGSVQLE